MTMELVVRRRNGTGEAERLIVGNRENRAQDWYFSAESPDVDLLGWSSRDYSSVLVPDGWWRIKRLITAVETEPTGEYREGVCRWYLGRDYMDELGKYNASRVDLRLGGSLLVEHNSSGVEIEFRHTAPDPIEGRIENRP